MKWAPWTQLVKFASNFHYITCTLIVTFTYTLSAAERMAENFTTGDTGLGRSGYEAVEGLKLPLHILCENPSVTKELVIAVGELYPAAVSAVACGGRGGTPLDFLHRNRSSPAVRRATAAARAALSASPRSPAR